jgi:hypothetical protein
MCGCATAGKLGIDIRHALVEADGTAGGEAGFGLLYQ